MELKEPRPKKNCKLRQRPPLPLIASDDGARKFTGRFDGLSVVVGDLTAMKQLNSMGFFGKANLSRSYPTFNSSAGVTEIVRNRQFLTRKTWEKPNQKCSRKVIVVPDSESEDENYFTDLKPRYEIDRSDIKETLNLSLVEAYFLQTGVKCLDVYYEDELTNEVELWTLFSSIDKQFMSDYVVYHHFRKKNWVVKPGIKFGGDFLLYKSGPPFYHASYVVIIDILDEKLCRREDMQRRSMEFVHIIGQNRLCETAGKELLICQVIWPNNVALESAEDLSKVSINEVVMRRWTSNQEK